MKFNYDPKLGITMETDNPFGKEINKYIEKLVQEQEFLTAKYLKETGYDVKDICLVRRRTETGEVFYPDLKSNYKLDEDEAVETD